MAHWPDQRRILAACLAPFGTVVGTLTIDWQDGVRAGTPLLHLVKVGTPDVGLDRTDRVKVDAYAVGESAAIELAEQVLAYLDGHFHYDPDDEDAGLIDGVDVESGPVPVPQHDEDIALVTATYRCTARALGPPAA